MKNELYFYCEQNSPRIEYMVNYLFNERLGISLSIKSGNFNGIDTSRIINYSHKEIEGAFQILPAGLLQEEGINASKPKFKKENEQVTLFQTAGEANFPFDVLSAIFWLISRYEEYQPFKADKFGRFPATESLLFKSELLSTPIVDVWVNQLKLKLEAHFSGLKVNRSEYKFQPTIDIDSPWCYKYKGWFRSIGGIFRDVAKGKLNLVRKRLYVLLNKQADPFYQFDYLETIHQQAGVAPKYFILIGDHARYDKTTKYTHPEFQKLLIHLSKSNELGIHPSFRASGNVQLMEKEKKRLEGITGSPVTKNRQHFLKFRLPDYYRQLIQLGIHEDHSMGFADYTGFRAGTCCAFPFYDLEKEIATNLRIQPFAVMDVTLQQYLGLSMDEALQVVKEIVGEIKKVDGTFVSLWHNESLSDQFQWRGWRRVYEKLLIEAKK